MRRTALTALALSLLFATSLRAQDWSAEHREVWETVRTYWGMFTGGDIDGFAEYFHEDFTGWTYNAPEPRGKTDVVTSARRYQRDGALRTVARHGVALAAWRLGLDRRRLAGWVHR